jgi:hypothetical protein
VQKVRCSLVTAGAIHCQGSGDAITRKRADRFANRRVASN